MDLYADIRFLKGIGEKKAKLLGKLGIFSLYDALRHFPREYEDRRVIKSLINVQPGESVCVEGSPVAPPRLSRIRKGLDIVKCRISDGTVLCDVTFFNQSWQKDRLRTGENYIFYGKFGDGSLTLKELQNPVFERDSDDAKNRVTGRIMPIYHLTAGLGRAGITDIIRRALEAAGEVGIDDVLPQVLRDRFLLQNVMFAYHNIHFPESDDALHDARRRFVFEELFVLTLGLRGMKASRTERGLVLPQRDAREFERLLPFELTGAQKLSIAEVSADLSCRRPMNRLVQGDVGSGKTMVAAAAAMQAGLAGYQTAIMAPTELLAAQHFRTLAPLLARAGLNVRLLTGSTPSAEKREIYAALADGSVHVVTGTHALITGGVEFKALGLVVTDEQHRFGVNQRMALSAKGEATHTLVMSATPIPRTLALITYGDLDLSVIDELPPGRKPVGTYTVEERHRKKLNEFIRKLVGEGRQVFVVCPLVEDTEGLDDGRKAVEAFYGVLKTKTFPDLRVDFIHGKLKQKDKDAIMSRFAAGESDILVATTVIEVGIDVPNAALMIVENAERFGLSQLHQLRGRIGRGEHESYCILVAGGAQSEATKERLRVMCETSDGFKVAEADLKLRGPGDFFGSRQHGLPALKIADLMSDIETVKLAANAADELLARDAALALEEHAPLRAAVERLFRDSSMN